MKKFFFLPLCLIFVLLAHSSVAQGLKASKTKFKKLSSDPVYLTNSDDKVITDGRFYFGEKIFVHFDGIVGLVVKNDKVSPQVRINVYDDKGKLAFGTEKELTGIGELPSETNSIFAYVEIGAPIFSKKTFSAVVELVDGNGKGSIKHSFQFRVLRDNKILRSSRGLVFKEVYLYSRAKGKVVLNHEVDYNEVIFVVIEGIDGFVEKEGLINIGMNIRIISNEGELLLEQNDLIKDPAPAVDVHGSLMAHAYLNSEETDKIPATLELLIYDKDNKDHFIQLKTEVLFKEVEEEKD